MDKQLDHASDLKDVHYAIKQANKAGLLTEVVTYALYEMRSDPSLTVGQAMEQALYEWDC